MTLGFLRQRAPEGPLQIQDPTQRDLQARQCSVLCFCAKSHSREVTYVPICQDEENEAGEVVAKLRQTSSGARSQSAPGKLGLLL